MATNRKKGARQAATAAAKRAGKTAAKKVASNVATKVATKGAKKTAKKSAARSNRKSTAGGASNNRTAAAAWRATVVSALDWREAHATLDDAVRDLAPELHGRRPQGLEHSPWELLQHIRLTQADLADFMEDPDYVAPEWPRDYWPPSAEPPNAGALRATISAIHRDMERIRSIALRPSLDLTSEIPWGEGKTYLRTILVAVVHSSYHIAQIIDARRVLGAWPS